jgi:hypothetical protein
LSLALLCFFTNSALFLKLYPVLVSGALLIAFSLTLLMPPPMIFRFAVLQDKTIPGSLAEKRVETYCRKVTLVWCGFFIMNGGIAALTVFAASDALWSLYNGGISYMLIGILFAGELMVRKRTQKKMPRALPLSALAPASRPAAAVLCYEGAYTGGIYKTWGDFLGDTARLRRLIGAQAAEKWLLDAEDRWFFLTGFTALLQCKKQVLLTAGSAGDYIAGIRQGGAAVLTDQVRPDSFFLPDLLAAEAEGLSPAEPFPAINRDEAVILMYPPETAGKPEAVSRRLTEFEADTALMLSKWGEEWLSRKACSTVGLHHLYGLLFSILLPFTAGIPFRRFPVRHPEELETLTDDSYMIITSPAFLKRAVETESAGGGRLSFPWIFSSGGVLDEDTARKTGEVLGFWPVEVYGGDETGGIACRQSGELLKEDVPAAIRGVSCLRVLERTDNSVSLEILIPAESDYFDGHFPQFKLLPAVAQLELAARFASRYFGLGVGISGAKRVKFSAMLRPDSRAFLDLHYQREKREMIFKFRGSGETVYSVGTLLAGSSGAVSPGSAR